MQRRPAMTKPEVTIHQAPSVLDPTVKVEVVVPTGGDAISVMFAFTDEGLIVDVFDIVDFRLNIWGMAVCGSIDQGPAGTSSETYDEIVNRLTA